MSFLKKCIIATGSRAFVPQNLGLEKINYMTNKEVFNPKNFSSLVILGGGVIGCELAQAFSNLGVSVSVIVRGDKILGKEDLDASKVVLEEMKEMKINFYFNSQIKSLKEKNKIKEIEILNSKNNSISKIKVDEILIATGRTPNIEGLNLEKAGVKFSQKGILVDEKTRTSNKKIFSAGDVAFGELFTHFANHQAKISLTNALFKTSFAFEKKIIPRVTFTTPVVASCGINESEAEKDDLILKKNYTKIDKALTDNNTRGFFKIIVSKKGVIKGAILCGKGSDELIGEIALAMKNKISINDFAGTIHPYPTYSYGLRNCCDQFRAKGYTNFKKKIIKKIFGLRGEK